MSVRRTLYSLLLYLIFPLVIFRLFWRSQSNPAYRKRIAERLGFVKRDSDNPIIWVHAVSVGETIAAQPLIEGLIKQYSEHRILVTTTTPTGSDRVKALFGDRVAHVYFPYDLPEVVGRFITRIKPQMLIVIETEIWPNLYAKCGKNNIPLVLVNARLSMRSTQKYLKIKKLVSETLSHVRLIAVRSSVDAERFNELGVDNDKINIAGNIKFDFTLNKNQIEQGKLWRAAWMNNDLIWVAASTHAGEDEEILKIHQSLLEQFSNLMLIIVPRHPERFDEVFSLCKALDAQGIKTLRHSQVRSQGKGYADSKAQIILADSMGEMQSWFAAADVVFMGGSLVETGGHNPIEPIAQGVPVISGPYMFNFDDVTPLLSEKGLLFIAESSNAVERQLAKQLKQVSDSKEVDFEANAKEFMREHQGVTARLLDNISAFLHR